MYYPALTSPAFWQGIRENPAYRAMLDHYQKEWADCAAEELPAQSYSRFISYHEKGSREEYAVPYNRRRRALSASAILSLLYPENEAYFTKLCDVIWAILDEYSWIVPAHMPAYDRIVEDYIDLYASETGAALSEIDAIFADRLPPLIRARIAREVERRIIQVYVQNHFSWEKNTANWAAVCSGNVGIAILYQRPELMPEVLPRIRATMDGFLGGFTEDGVCLEGIGYWTYGFGYFLWFADLLRLHTGGAVDLTEDPRVRKIARFPQMVFLDGAVAVSFSDTGGSARWHPAVLSYLKRRYPEEIQLPSADLLTYEDAHGRWAGQIRGFLFYDPEAAAGVPVIPGEEWAPDAQWLIRRERRYCFAAKGGHNWEPHNHNDIGSFILTKDGRQVLCDPGAGPYHKTYFGKERYTYFQAGSQGHSVPVIGGRYQAPGREHHAEAVYEGGVLTLEMAAAYDIPELRGLRREFSFTEGTVTVADTFDFAGEALPVTERFICRCPAVVDGDAVRVGGVTLMGDGVPTVTEVDGVWCVEYAVNSGGRFVLRVEV